MADGMMMEPSTEGGGEVLNQLLKINNLAFEEPRMLTLTQAVRGREFPTQSSEVNPSDTFFIDLTPGSDLINGRESYLQGNLEITADMTAGDRTADGTSLCVAPFAGLTTLFRHIVVRSRTGQEYQRLTDRHIQMRHEASVKKNYASHQQGASTYYGNLQHPIQAGGTLGGISDQAAPFPTAVIGDATLLPTSNRIPFNYVAPGGAVTTRTIPFSIPLSLLVPFFDTPNLVPTNASGQIRLEFTTVPVNEPFFAVGTDGTSKAAQFNSISWKLKNLSVMAECHTLSEAALKALAIIGSEVGLAHTFRDIVTNQFASGLQSTYTIATTAARARCIGAWVHIREDQQSGSYAFDSTATVAPEPELQIQFNLGSQYFPVRAVGGSRQKRMEIYQHTMQAERRIVSGSYDQACEVPYQRISRAQQRGVDDPSWLTGGFGFVSCLLERSDIMEGNGSLVSASRPLIVNVSNSNPGGQPRSVFVFLAFHKLAMIFSDGNVVLNEVDLSQFVRRTMAIRDPSVAKQLYINSATGRADGTLSNFGYFTAPDRNMQRVKGAQLLNVAFTPLLYNVPAFKGGVPGNQFEWREFNKWHIPPQASALKFHASMTNGSGVLLPRVTYNLDVVIPNLGPDSNTQDVIADEISNALTVWAQSVTWPGTVVNIQLLHWGLDEMAFSIQLTGHPQLADANLLLTARDNDEATLSFLGVQNEFIGGTGIPGIPGLFNYWFFTDSYTITPVNGLGEIEYTQMRKTVTPGNYTHTQLVAAINAAVPEVVSHPGGNFPPSAITLSVVTTPGNFNVTVTEMADPLVGEGNRHKSIQDPFIGSPLGNALGFAPVFKHGPNQWQQNWAASAPPNLTGPTFLRLHCRPINEGSGIVHDDGVIRRISAWANVPINGFGVPVFYDYTYAAEAAYFNGFVEPLDCTRLDFALRTPEGDDVELTESGLDVAIKMIILP